MSRIGKAPITLPQGVTVTLDQQNVLVTGKLGKLSYQVLEGITIKQEENLLIVERADDSKRNRALHGLTRALVQNMVTGVSVGYEKTLHVIGTGYGADRIGPWLKLALGYSHDILMQVPDGIEVVVEAVPRTKGGKADLQSIIKVRGIHKEDVGKFSAEVRKCRPPENYKGKGVRYSDERIMLKAGKAGSK